MTSLQNYIGTKKANGEKIVSIYLTAGYPTLDATLPLLETIADAGADLIELGIPFSDPLADGPTIQEASQIALKNGISMSKILEILKDFKKNSDVPVILMGYANPFMQFGWEKLFAAAAENGGSGFIIPDLPPEESEDIQKSLQKNGLDLVFLAAPNTPEKRLSQISELTTSFIYAVSITGVTGAREKLPEETIEFLQQLRQKSAQAVLVGFGISGPESAQAMSRYSDGVIIGSAIIKCIANESDFENGRKAVFEFVSGIKEALVGANEE